MTVIDQSSVDLESRIEELKSRARKLRAELPVLAAKADADNVDAGPSVRRIWEEGFFDFNLPVAYGGINDANVENFTKDYFEMVIELVAGDSSAGMNFVVQSLVTIEVFAEGNDLPTSTKDELARLIKEEGIRFVASNSETGSPQPVIGRRVEGGIRLSGTKTFNTNSGGGGWANVGLKIEGEEGTFHALVPLDQAGVTCRHDWDVMGQRGTHSQTIQYDDIFVSDDYVFARNHFTGSLVAHVFLMHAAIMLGPGFGALDAAIDYVRNMDRPSLPEFDSASEDPLIRRRIGEFAVELQAARAYLLHAASRISLAREDEVSAMIEAFAVKVACVRASLDVTQGIFDLTGARSTSAKYRFDRFWRNAATFSTHDPTDAKSVWVGDYYLNGTPPPIAAMLRV